MREGANLFFFAGFVNGKNDFGKETSELLPLFWFDNMYLAQSR